MSPFAWTQKHACWLSFSCSFMLGGSYFCNLRSSPRVCCNFSYFTLSCLTVLCQELSCLHSSSLVNYSLPSWSLSLPNAFLFLSFPNSSSVESFVCEFELFQDLWNFESQLTWLALTLHLKSRLTYPVSIRSLIWSVAEGLISVRAGTTLFHLAKLLPIHFWL